MNPENENAANAAALQSHSYLKVTTSDKPSKFTQHTSLHYACQHGRLDNAHELVTNFNCSIESKDAEGCSPLHIAAQYGQVETLRYLLHKLFSYEVSGLSLKHAHSDKLSHTLSSMFQQTLSDRHRDNSGNTPLHTACVYGQLAVVEFLTHNIGCDPNSTNNKGLSCLHLAAQYGHLPLVRYLIEEVGSDLTLENRYGKPPTYLAAARGHIHILRYLVEEKGTNFHFKTSIEWKSVTYRGITLVHIASLKGQLDVVKYLIEHCGCNPSPKDHKGFTPLHLACQGGHKDIVSYLITECHCDPNCTTSDDSKRMTPLHFAASVGHIKIVKFLVESVDCEPSTRDYQRRTPLHFSSGNGHLHVVEYLISTCHCDPTCTDENGGTPLHYAAGVDIMIVRYILFISDADPLLRDMHNNTPLHHAARNNCLEVVKLYIEEMSCDPNIKAHQDNTPLHLASRYGHLDVVKYLLNTCCCDPQCTDANGMTPLHYAAAGGSVDVVEFILLLTGTDHLPLDNSNNTPLHYAVKNNSIEVVQHMCTVCRIDSYYHQLIEATDDVVMLQVLHDYTNPLTLAAEIGDLETVQLYVEQKGWDPLEWDKQGLNVLHYASQNGHLKVVKYFSEEGKVYDLNSTDENGNTPLHHASCYGHLDVVKCLTGSCRSDPFCENLSGFTPSHLAVRNNHLHVVTFLNEEVNSNIEYEDSFQDSLRCAAIYGYTETVKYYIKSKKWDPLKPDRYGNNTLHNAAQHGRLEVVQYLTGLSKDPISEGVEIICDPLVKNKYGLTALDIASQNGHRHVVSYLLRATSNQLISEPDILSPVLSIFVVGNSGSGKSTLVKALSSESSLLGAIVKVKGVTPLTAGIVSTSLQSKMFGTVNIYDFAGHEEYYASHEMILSQTTQPLVLLAVDVSLPEQDVKRQVEYWLAILTNSLPADAKKTVHVLIVGSHVDQIKFLEKKDIYQHVTTWVTDSASLLKYHGFIQCDCRYPSSDNLKQLRLKLATICKSIRLFLLANESDNSNKLCAALMYHLEHSKPQQATVTVRELFHLLAESISPGSGLAPFADEKLLFQTCKMLNSLGHLLFLPHDEREMDSVIILDKDTILSKIHACLQVKGNLTNEIGILGDADLREVLSLSLEGIMEPELAIRYLIFAQFCTEVTATQLISPPENFTGLVHYFFPNLVSASRPADLLPLGDQHYTHFYTWGLECTGANQFFTPRFLHTLFIQLAKCERDAITARFIIWKNGILLVHNNGTRSILEVTDQTTRLHLAMQCVEGCESYLVKQRSALIHLVKSLLDKLCPRKVDTKEFLLLPQKAYPCNCNNEIPLNDVAQSVIDRSPTVVFNYENIPISKLLYFDSFHVIKDLTLQDIFARCQSTELVPSTTLNEVLSVVKGCEELASVLETEASSQGITYIKMYSELTKYSIFTEGNLYELVGVSISSVYNSKERIPEGISNLDPLSITDLYLANINLIEVACPWKFGRALGLKPHTLEKIKSRYSFRHPVDRCLTEVLAAWLEGEDRPHDSPAPCWEEVVAALKSVDKNDYAHQLVQKLTSTRPLDPQLIIVPARAQDTFQEHYLSSKLSSNTNLEADGVTETEGVEDPFDSVDNSVLAPEALREVCDCVYDLDRKWFHLGLSLGLRYPTLKNIEASHHVDIGDHMTEMLQKWLRGVDQETTTGVSGPPSWRTLAKALSCPLVKGIQASSKVENEHKVNQLLLGFP